MLRLFSFAFLIAAISLTINVSNAQGMGQRSGTSGKVMLGIDVLEANGFAGLVGKRVGLVTNHTSYNSRGIKTRLVLHRERRVKLVALYAPEHGIDGNIRAGKYVSTRKDSLTGLTVFSLYGPNRKPTLGMLKGIDVLVFDLQDIGCRSYTYVSTMIKCLEAVAEKGIPLMVLDRPNPLEDSASKALRCKRNGFPLSDKFPFHMSTE